MRASTRPLSTSFLSRVSTKIPCWGRTALGYNVVKVRICTCATGRDAAAEPASHNAGRLMPVYRNPDFRRLPSGLAAIFAAGGATAFSRCPAGTI